MSESPFSTQVPQLQLAWDSVSMTTFLECPRKYQYRILEGWISRVKKVELEFGILIHKGLEIYYRLLADGLDYDAAVFQASKHLLELSQDFVPDEDVYEGT